MCGSSFLCDRHEESFLAPSCSNICVHWKPPEGQILLKVLIILCIHQTVVSLVCCRGRYSLQVSQLLWLTITDWSYLTVDCEQSRRDQIRFSCRQNKVLINVFVCFCWMVCHIKEQMQCWRRAFLEARLFEVLHRAAAWCRSRCRAWTSTGHRTNEAVVLSHRFTLDGSAVHHQPFSTHADTPWNDLKSPVNLMCMFLDSGKNQEYPEKQAHRNAEVTTKRRSFLPCLDSADHHRAAMPLHW